MRTDPELPAVFTRAEARAAGLTDRQIDRRLAAGRFRAVRRGVLVVADAAEPGGPTPLLERIRAAWRAGPAGLVLSHHTAAAAWGLPTPLGKELPVCATRRPDGRACTRYYPDLTVEVASLPPVDVIRHDGLLITSAARTVADCLRHLDRRDGLAIADAAAHQGLTDVAEVADVLARCAHWPGVRTAHELVDLVDGRRESPLESWSALAFHDAGLAPPVPQVQLLDAHRRATARVDYWWAEGVAGEADGRAKYLLRAAARAGATDEALVAVLTAERSREQAVRELGAELERWGAGDVLDPARTARLVARITRAREVAAGPGCTFRVALTPPPVRRCSPEPPPLAVLGGPGGSGGEQRQPRRACQPGRVPVTATL